MFVIGLVLGELGLELVKLLVALLPEAENFKNELLYLLFLFLDLAHIGIDLDNFPLELLQSLGLQFSLSLLLLVRLQEFLNEFCLANSLRVGVDALELCGKLVALVLDRTPLTLDLRAAALSASSSR